MCAMMSERIDKMRVQKTCFFKIISYISLGDALSREKPGAAGMVNIETPRTYEMSIVRGEESTEEAGLSKDVL